MMATYITSTDLTDSILTGFDTTAYLVRANLAIENLAREYGVQVNSIVTPIDYNVKLWAVYWLMKEILREKSLENNITGDASSEKYLLKYQMYYDECNRMKRTLNREMFLGMVVNAATASATSGKMLRG
jgi:hypothetical protein